MNGGIDVKTFRRTFLIVLDSVGIGEAPDAAEFDDSGADTLGHIADARDGLHTPNMEKLGLGNIRQMSGIEDVADPAAYYGKMREASNGKDTMTGHWEMMGLRIEQPFRTFPEGFPTALLKQIEEKTGRQMIGNKPASGTEIIQEFGQEHIETGSLIVYTSADPVMQIAAHENIVPPDELYSICETARELTKDEPYKIGRVIARPFEGKSGEFRRRSDHRHDYALGPSGQTVMNGLKDDGYNVLALGKINDIYNGEGVTTAIPTENNMDGVDKLIDTMDHDFCGLAFLNLVDFDAKYGHRRDVQGYGDALEAFDQRLTEILAKVNDDDLLIITADHGNDPVHHGTDHTRELVPLLVYHSNIDEAVNLGVRDTFSDIGATIAHNFDVPPPAFGQSFLQCLTE